MKRNKLKTILLSLAVTSLISYEASALNTSTISPSSPSTFRGVRQLGMGNASIALHSQTENHRDNTAWLYNPASINDYERDFYFGIMQVQGDISFSAISLVKDSFSLADDIDGAATTQDKINTFNTFVENRFGNYESLDVRAVPFLITHKWFSLGVIADSRTSISMRNRSFTNMEIFSRSDGGVVGGGAYSFFDDQLQVGGNLKVLYRGEVDELITMDDILNQDNLGVNLNRGLGVGGDLGLKGKIPTGNIRVLSFLKPTAGVTYQDVGNTRFSGDVSNTKQSVGVGLAVHPRIPLGRKGLASHLAIDYREINHKRHWLTKLSVGYELELPTLLFINTAVRGGLSEGYPTGGFSVDLKLAKIEAAIYKQEVGTVTRQKGIWRVAFNLAAGF